MISSGEFQDFQVIVLWVFGAVDWPLAPCLLVHFLEICFKRQLFWQFDITEKPIFIFSILSMILICTHLNISQYDNTLFLFALFPRPQQCFTFANYYCALLFHRHSQDVFYLFQMQTADSPTTKQHIQLIFTLSSQFHWMPVPLYPR